MGKEKQAYTAKDAKKRNALQGQDVEFSRELADSDDVQAQERASAAKRRQKSR
jgi:hypothetical protein